MSYSFKACEIRDFCSYYASIFDGKQETACEESGITRAIRIDVERQEELIKQHSKDMIIFSSDYRSFRYVDGEYYEISEDRAPVIKCLHKAYKNQYPHVHVNKLKEVADKRKTYEYVDIFRTAKKQLKDIVCKSDMKGHRQLNPKYKYFP